MYVCKHQLPIQSFQNHSGYNVGLWGSIKQLDTIVTISIVEVWILCWKACWQLTKFEAKFRIIIEVIIIKHCDWSYILWHISIISYVNVSWQKNNIKPCTGFQRIRSVVDEKEQRSMLMELDAVMRSNDCPYIVQFYGALFKEVILQCYECLWLPFLEWHQSCLPPTLCNGVK